VRVSAPYAFSGATAWWNELRRCHSSDGTHRCYPRAVHVRASLEQLDRENGRRRRSTHEGTARHALQMIRLRPVRFCGRFRPGCVNPVGDGSQTGRRPLTRTATQATCRNSCTVKHRPPCSRFLYGVLNLDRSQYDRQLSARVICVHPPDKRATPTVKRSN
jgi:hypothetical protein